MNPSFLRLWGAAILIGIATVIGLLCALFGEGIWDLISAVALGVPVLVGGWYSLKRRTKKS